MPSAGVAEVERRGGLAGVAGADFLRIEGVSKRFGVTQALSDVSVTFRAGEVHALMGENGAGKSTLGKAIAGLHRPDSGRISVIDGGGDGAWRELQLGDIDDAFDAGIRIVHQELAQCPNLSVAENLCLHDMPTRGGRIDRDAMNQRAARLLRDLAPEIDVRAALGDLAPGRRQIVQIAASLDEGERGEHKPRAIIFDEPTSSLSMGEADRLMRIIRTLAGQGLLAIYVSHRMGEIFQVCDRVTVLRDGKFVATSVIKEINEQTLVSQMIGRTIDSSASYRASKGAGTDAAGGVAKAPALRVRGVSSPGKLHSISLEVRPREVLGIGGLVGSGRSELLDAIFGLDPRASGEVEVNERALPMAGVRERIAMNVGYVPEDRRLQGLFFQLGIDENIVEPAMPLLAKLGIRRRVNEHQMVSSRVGRFRIKAASHASLPGALSGGNQQKLLIARWMDEGTSVLLLDEPTRGIDVGTKTEIYRLVREAAEAGLAVLLVSSEMPELLALSDRVVVMCDGRLTGELRGEEMTQERILKLATIGH
ncbi:MAG: sugar ABC transporter ATP-binding protein [Phycisphaerales bacterium]|nr:sugar ABC transporter ATP-binding protein [Phycisphaerales bacterium]